MLDEKTRFTGLPNVSYSDSNKTTRALLNAGWVRAPLQVQKTVYDISIELLDLYCARQGKELSDPKRLAEEARITAQAYSRFCSHIIKSYDQLRREEHEYINPTVEAMVAPAHADSPTYQGQSEVKLRAIKIFRKLIFDSMLESHPEGLQHFFSLLHRKGFADQLAEQVKEHDFSMKVGAAYRHWLKRNPQVPANDSKYATVHAGTVPASDLTSVNEHKSLVIINQRREISHKLRDKASCSVQREIHSRLLDLLDCCEKEARGGLGFRLRDQFISEVAHRYSRVYVFAAMHFHSFTVDDREQVLNGLSTLLTVPPPTNSQLSRMSLDEYKMVYLNEQKEVMEQFPRETHSHFFQSLYQYGFEKLFNERISAHAVSGKMKGAYDLWLLENKNWIDKKEWLKEPKAVVLPEGIKTAPASPILAPILNSEPMPACPAPLTLKETLAVASRNPQLFVTPEPEIKAAPIQAETPKQRYERQMRERDEKKKKANGWDLTVPVKPTSAPVVVKPLIKGPDISELTLEQLEEMTKPSTPAVVEAVPAEEVVATQTPVEMLATSEIRPIVRTALNIIGCDEDSRDSIPGQGKKTIEAKYANGENGHPAQDRHGILLGALATDEVTGKLIYPYIQPVDSNASVKVYPYNVVDIEYIVHDDVERARILVCDFQGFATFICRDTQEFDPDDEISINQLRDDPKVWMVPFINQAQWVREIQQRLYTPVHQMEVQLKRSHFWKNRAGALEDTLLHIVVATGKEPERTTKVFDVGPLAGQATGMAADAALKRHTVEGFEGAGSLKCLFKLMCEKHPGLAKFVGDKPFRVSAQDVCAQVQAEKIADWKRAVLELAFKYGAVDGLDVVLPGAKPQSFDEFVRLVRKPGGEDRPELSV